MKNQSFRTFQVFIVLLLFLCSSSFLSAQDPCDNVGFECYKKFLNQGIQFLRDTSYEKAINKFNAARACPDLECLKKTEKVNLEYWFNLTLNTWTTALDSAKSAAERNAKAAQAREMEALESERKAIEAQKQEGMARKDAEERLLIIKSSFIAIEALEDLRSGFTDDGYRLAYHAYRMLDTAKYKPQKRPRIVEKAWGHAVFAKFANTISPEKPNTAIVGINITQQPDQDWFISYGRDLKLNVFDIKGQQIMGFQPHQDLILSAALSSDNQSILTASKDHTAKLWTNNGNLIANFIGHEDAVTNALFSPDESKIITLSRDKTAKVWEKNGDLYKQLNGHNSPILDADFSKNGKYMITRSARQVRVWSTEDYRFITELSIPDPPIIYFATFSPSGKKILTGSSDDKAREWNLEGALLDDSFNHSSDVYTGAYLTETRFLTGTRRGLVYRWDKDKEPKIFPPSNGYTNAIIKGSNTQSALATFGDSTAIIIENDGTVKPILDHRGKIYSGEFSFDNSKVLTYSEDGSAKLYDISLEDVIMNLDPNKGGITQATFSRDGNHIILGTEQGAIVICPMPNFMYEEVTNTSLREGTILNQQLISRINRLYEF